MKHFLSWILLLVAISLPTQCVQALLVCPTTLDHSHELLCGYTGCPSIFKDNCTRSHLAGSHSLSWSGIYHSVVFWLLAFQQTGFPLFWYVCFVNELALITMLHSSACLYPLWYYRSTLQVNCWILCPAFEPSQYLWINFEFHLWRSYDLVVVWIEMAPKAPHVFECLARRERHL